MLTGYRYFGTGFGCPLEDSKGCTEETTMNKGIFWFPCSTDQEGELVFTGEILALLIPCDEDGNPKAAASFNSVRRIGISFGASTASFTQSAPVSITVRVML